VAPPLQVRSDVLMLTSDLIAVKSSDGMSALIPFGKETTVDSGFKVGDRFEIIAASGNQTTKPLQLRSFYNQISHDPIPRMG
jgi:hypothetical protein